MSRRVASLIAHRCNRPFLPFRFPAYPELLRTSLTRLVQTFRAHYCQPNRVLPPPVSDTITMSALLYLDAIPQSCNRQYDCLYIHIAFGVTSISAKKARSPERCHTTLCTPLSPIRTYDEPAELHTQVDFARHYHVAVALWPQRFVPEDPFRLCLPKCR